MRRCSRHPSGAGVTGVVERIDIGHGVEISFTSWGTYDRVGLIEWHRTPDGRECSGGFGASVLFDLPGVREAFPNSPLWLVASFDPLTLTPSLLCRTCGHHGWITNGEWNPA